MSSHLFRALGSTEFFVDGERVQLGGVKRKLILGAFLLRPNQPLSTHKLHAVLWESPPTSGMANLYTYLSELRRVLTVGSGPASRTLLVRDPDGHRLEVETDEVDLLMFSEHARRGHELLARAEHEKAAEELGAADALWQGTPLEGLPSNGWMQAEVRRWEEARITQLKEWIDARLMLGRHQTLAAELRTYLELHPLAEALWGQLMLALYRSGRQGEALGTFTEARSRLRSELGVEPSVQLRELHHAILTQSPTLDLQPSRSRTEVTHPSARPADRVPSQLPAAPEDLIGRDAETARLIEALTEPENGSRNSRVAVITGPPGSGKTALALHVAHQVRHRFPDGQLFLALPGPGSDGRDTARVLRDVLLALGADRALLPEGLEQLAASFRMRLADTRVLVVVDDAGGSEQVSDLLPGTVGSAVLVTSRLQLPALYSAHTATLGPLPEEEALALLRRLVGAARLDAEPQAARFIAAACDFLPLAMRIAGARIALRSDQSLNAFAERFLYPGRKLGEFVHDGLDLRSAFEASYRALDPLAAETFVQLGRAGGRAVDVAAVAELTGRDRREADLALEQLIAGNLVRPVKGPGGSRSAYQLSGLLGAYAAELGLPPGAGADQRRLPGHLPARRTPPASPGVGRAA
nr:SARP family transcriptional regulator [bacterium]